MSDVVWQAIIAGAVTLVLAWVNKRTAAKAEAKLNEIAVVADKTHVLVNSSMGAQLKIAAVALRRLALLTKNPKDVAAAAMAEQLLMEHEGKQAKVDAGHKG